MKENKKAVSTVRCMGIEVHYYSINSSLESGTVYTYSFGASYPYGNLTIKDTAKSLFTIGKDYTVTIASKV